ncbi:MAG: hypothetical protein Q8P61_09245 [Candidatus Nanopelagicales bacterium]|nr:hypothetical protein [Candidatus Nanopelagicales bacterium]
MIVDPDRKAELVLHIGTHKTGSTFIQRTLAASRALLAGAGWCYPDFLPADNHARVLLPFTNGAPQALYRRQQVTDPAATLRQLDQQFAARVAPGQRWVMSSEQASSMLDAAGWQDLLQFLGTHFSPIRLVVYYRRQDFHMCSAYGQNIKMGWDFDFGPDYLKRIRRRLDHLGHHAQLAGLSGCDELLARPYLERYKRAPLDLIADFASTVGLRLPDGEQWRTPPPGTNSSHTAEGIWLLKALNPQLEWDQQARPVFPAHRRAVVEAVRRVTEGPGLRPSEQLAAAVQAQFWPGNDVLVGQVGRSSLWQEWLDQPIRVADEQALTIKPERLVELLTRLSASAGPIDLGAPGLRAARTDSAGWRAAAGRLKRRLRGDVRSG